MSSSDGDARTYMNDKSWKLFSMRKDEVEGLRRTFRLVKLSTDLVKQEVQEEWEVQEWPTADAQNDRDDAAEAMASDAQVDRDEAADEQNDRDEAAVGGQSAMASDAL